MEGNACAHGIAEWGCLLDSMVDVHISNFPNHIIGDIMADLERRLLERFGDVCCSRIFWVLVLAHHSLFIGFYVTLFSRELKIVGFLVSFIFVALLSSSELESPLKTL
ncbi:hypothetical protein KFK09_024501 [Dendrobium nobile]|uniref:Uncharacterized protein n=1 Tax=Dendrobium nobile TaxID=94219 RepID=A0A8T3AD83_DENNO|nr:hypothetical protein KFK09_024501 [Dendrobium nobile]